MATEKLNKAQKEVAYWKERYKNASSNLGKWYCQIRIDKATEKISTKKKK